MSKVEDVDLLSDNSLVVLSKLPSWPVRWGILIVSLILAFVIMISALIPFPESVEGRVQLQTGKELSNIYPNNEGYLKQILVDEGDTVEKGQLLGEMQVNASIYNIETLQEKLASLDSGYLDTLMLIKQMKELDSLADLGDDIQMMISKLRISRDLRLASSAMQDLEYYESKKAQIKRLIELGQADLALKKQEKALAWERYQTNKSLFLDSVISLKDYRLSTETFLKVRSTYLALQRSLEQQALQLIEFEKSEIEQSQTNYRASRDLDLQIEELKVRLINRLQNLEKSRFLKASKVGRVHLHTNAKSGTLVDRNVPLFAIEDLSGEFIAIAKVKSDKIGKLKVGQQAFIDLDAYSKSETGRLEAELVEIGELLTDEHYQLKLQILETEQFSEGFKAEMSGKVMIVCESKTLLERVFMMRRF